MDYFAKIAEEPQDDLTWNIPEQKQGIVNVIGGNSQAFKTAIKVAEFLLAHYPIKTVNAVLPDALKNQLPPLLNLQFLSSTDSGSFLDAEELKHCLQSADFNLLLGDFSKNAITMQAVASACESSEKPLLITRDAVDLIISTHPEKVLLNDKIIWLASMAQLQKLLRAIYYPKMLLLSQSLVQVSEVLHKFSLSYPVSLITLHNDQILVAKNGLVRALPLARSGYTPIFFWQGELAAKIVTMNLYNPDNFINATVAGILNT